MRSRLRIVVNLGIVRQINGKPSRKFVKFKSGSKKYRVNNKKFSKFERRSLKFVLCL